MKYKLEITNLVIKKNKMEISVLGEFVNSNIYPECLSTPKVILYFDNGIEDRRIPIPIEIQNIIFSNGKCMFSATYTYYLDFIFWKTRQKQIPFNMFINLSFMNYYEEKVKFDVKNEKYKQDKKYYVFKLEEKYFNVTKCMQTKDIGKLSSFYNVLKNMWRIIKKRRFSITHICELSKKKYKQLVIKKRYKQNKFKPINPNKITFYSTRREEISGNFKFVYEKLKKDKNLDIQFLFNTKYFKDMTNEEIDEFVNACATSKVIVIDEFTPQINFIDLKPETKLIQLWHACGAFKTFGFSRMHKEGGPYQDSRGHRLYDYVTVSSTYCKKCHSEGFGIPTKNVVPTGIARTDIFFDEKYKIKVKEEFYNKYPNLKNKKIILFAPTFRGVVKEYANYPMELFDIKQVCDYLGDDYAIIIKHHPFIKEKHYIPEEYRDRVIDLSENTEINDLLFVANLVITDYSSLVFEASLLNLPMLFYVYDLKEYIEERDFYFDFEYYIPGVICKDFNSLLENIKKGEYNLERLNQFRNMFFDDLDGNSSQRIADLIYKALGEKK